ncbi:single-stranded DNA-binding protein [Lactobacillus sp.] [Lactiplantibacillus mudanjiangensis]|uniref:RNA-binding cell elongation regulator Jag/EloR n=1 Tax=Lactiplantibacillus mudanjiangensis TaxID=1296538 RepID=UPI0010156128|nr:single-stranded DNA-binding protein [Lactobacillus sp.] [Lactiplantibacillus mudanjiangensis]
MTVFEGHTVEAAIAAGLKQLQTTRDQVNTKVIANPKKGFLGLGKRLAQVEITVKPVATPVAPSQPAAVSKKAVVKPKMPQSSKPKAKAPVKPKAAVKASPKPAKVVETPQRTDAEIAERQAANEQAVRDLSAYLLEVAKQLGIPADLDVDFGNRYATLNFDTAKQGLLIGKHGRTINALQDLAQVYMNHHGASHVNVVLDVDDYRERRAETLKRLAESTAREAVATGKQVFLDPMPSFERKLIHAELADNNHVTTFSEGRDPHRAVVVASRK